MALNRLGSFEGQILHPQVCVKAKIALFIPIEYPHEG